MNRAAALRVSLLVSIGVAPFGCGGTMLRGGDDEEGPAGSGGTSAGTGAGPGAVGGTTSGAGSFSNASGSGGTLGSRGGCTDDGKLSPSSGLTLCKEGYLARPKAVECDLPLAGAGGERPFGLPPANGAACDSDSDCSRFRLGYCQDSQECGPGAGGQTGTCESGCEGDDDCGIGHICICDGSAHGGACVRSNCRTDSDCGPGLVCASLNSYGDLGFFCTSLKDECATNADCGDSQACELSEGYRQCFEIGICGRPFLVENAARLAPVRYVSTWAKAAALSPRVDHLSPSERGALAAHWTKLGQMEHASIAAFARFSLQLLALGAPHELVEGCTRALADETAHAVLCFGLASAYAGRAIGPGPLDVTNSLDVTALSDIVDLVIAEGCFGETSAALQALEAADRAADPVIAAAYRQIAVDEQRHAELAFAFVRWALQQDRVVVAERLAAALGSDLARSHAAREVTVPCLEALPCSLPAPSLEN